MLATFFINLVGRDKLLFATLYLKCNIFEITFLDTVASISIIFVGVIVTAPQVKI